MLQFGFIMWLTAQGQMLLCSHIMPLPLAQFYSDHLESGDIGLPTNGPTDKRGYILVKDVDPDFYHDYRNCNFAGNSLP